MTGFGKAVIELPEKKITVEIRSLNSKQLDLNTRIPPIYREKEMDIRSLIHQNIERGKVDFQINVENIGKNTLALVNQSAIESYYTQLNETAQKLNIITPQDWFSVLLRLPETIKTELPELNESEWNSVSLVIEKALEKLNEFRQQEGRMLQKLFEEKIKNIGLLLIKIEEYESERLDKIKNRIKEALVKLENSAYDDNRFEQELIYYIEKLDINEEKNRLNNHLCYFTEILNEDKSQGRKLGFIVQEIGREINTIGSKSNHAEMQKIVVQMKDELEQMKEQILNVL